VPYVDSNSHPCQGGLKPREEIIDLGDTIEVQTDWTATVLDPDEVACEPVDIYCLFRVDAFWVEPVPLEQPTLTTADGTEWQYKGMAYIKPTWGECPYHRKTLWDWLKYQFCVDHRKEAIVYVESWDDTEKPLGWYPAFVFSVELVPE
jgi:hypothetical protein